MSGLQGKRRGAEQCEEDDFDVEFMAMACNIDFMCTLSDDIFAVMPEGK
jgi:hypothetical protein